MLQSLVPLRRERGMMVDHGARNLGTRGAVQKIWVVIADCGNHLEAPKQHPRLMDIGDSMWKAFS